MSEKPEIQHGWGPSHQHGQAPRSTRARNIAIMVATAVVAFELLTRRLSTQGPLAALDSTLATMLHAALLLAAGTLAWRARAFLLGFVRSRQPPPGPRLGERLAGAGDPVRAVREHVRALGGGAFLGMSGGRWVTASPEHAVLVLGPPRSGKTSAIVIPALLSAPGAAVSTSTKAEVLQATVQARSALGQAWLFDPIGGIENPPNGVRRLHWSPIAAASTWDGALLTARAMSAATAPGAGTINESHWRERSAALLAPLLYAAHLGEASIGELLRWILRADLDPATQTLTDHDRQVPADVLAGIAATDARERSSIFSATAGVLAAYNADGARRTAATTNFDAERFAASQDTVYITAPAHAQALCAPLVVGLLEQIRHAAYTHTRHNNPAEARREPIFMCLDELANIAPIHDLPALISEAGGQGLHVLACLQDLSQARTRWGDAADGFLSLFQTKVILDGIADSRTLEAISLALGEYDRQMISHTSGYSRSEKILRPGPGTRTQSMSRSTLRQRVLSPGEIAKLPKGRGLILRGARWQLIRLTPWHTTEPWRTICASS